MTMMDNCPTLFSQIFEEFERFETKEDCKKRPCTSVLIPQEKIKFRVNDYSFQIDLLIIKNLTLLLLSKNLTKVCYISLTNCKYLAQSKAIRVIQAKLERQ